MKNVKRKKYNTAIEPRVERKKLMCVYDTRVNKLLLLTTTQALTWNEEKKLNYSNKLHKYIWHFINKQTRDQLFNWPFFIIFII